MKTVLELSNLEARQHFLKEESYFNFDLPQYYSFESLLAELSGELNGKLLSDFYVSNPSEGNSKVKKLLPSEIECVNYSFLVNKDGRFAWRPFQLIHPALYVSLVHAITEERYWHLIVSRFSEFKQAKGIGCFSIPLVSEGSLSGLGIDHIELDHVLHDGLYGAFRDERFFDETLGYVHVALAEQFGIGDFEIA
jgi:RNA-directed DNA polymerase